LANLMSPDAAGEDLRLRVGVAGGAELLDLLRRRLGDGRRNHGFSRRTRLIRTRRGGDQQRQDGPRGSTTEGHERTSLPSIRVCSISPEGATKVSPERRPGSWCWWSPGAALSLPGRCPGLS